MKRYRFLRICIVMCCVNLGTLSAQEFTPAGNTFFSDILTAEKVNPFNYLYLPVKNYTETGLFYTAEGGDFKDARIPSQMQDFGLQTQGIFKNESGILFYGDLSITKSYYKNLKWNLSYQLPENGLMEDPHYFGVARPGNWSNQDYDINGGIVFPINNKWHALAEVNYHLFNKYRNDRDPRDQITFNELVFNAGLNYQITPSQYLSLKAIYGATDVSNKTNYTNSGNDSPKNYRQYIKWITGYGSFSNPFWTSTMRNYHQAGITLGYTLENEIYTINIDVGYLQKKQDTYKKNNVVNKHKEEEFFAEYEPKTYSLDALLLKKQTENSHLKLQFSGLHTKAGNTLTNKGGQSYSASVTKANLIFGYLKTKQEKSRTDLGLGLGFTNSKQKDVLEQSRLEFSFLQPKIYAMKRYKISPNLDFLPKISGQVNISLNHQFNYPNASYFDSIEDKDFFGLTQKLFYEEVTLPNSELFSASNWQTSIDLGFNFNSFKNLDTYFTIGGGYQESFNNLQYFDNITPNRWTVSASLKVYY
ncbi:DUF6850 family outer membrane beta-barrel protein [Zunongwangia sp. HGR-M22]|uniref:DUF6850 family outer membrane beta-barrel protein n=1 Tax=Zunongwangia sp. HGR-M22 TaxID=3015168 RepID=UPI0022DD3E21|nr:DUF6850 family outer membrane beta-barrel protein [Zunongwangia sp. HGR-M22]WBL26800.1 hypothetical protein PBT91_05930 [Zunongwangia sp. HGR-M22]